MSADADAADADLAAERRLNHSIPRTYFGGYNDIHAASLSISPAIPFTDGCVTKQHRYSSLCSLCSSDSPFCSCHQRY